jgi:hypothetical protein
MDKNNREGANMKAFLSAIVVAIGMGLLAATVLETSQKTVESQFSSRTSVRN